ncbi:Imm1 family immunity protein [Streptomyces sp. NBC_01221]|uniref:Imm1 family immunity protein n=1 Tax=Streptomyces sp. NBC_01221 TaxID=2903782 RepID=UPI00338EFE00
MIHRCRVHLLPGPAAAINHSNPGRAGHTPGPWEVTYFVAENPTEFPATAEIPLALVRQAAKEFLSSGGRRPTCTQWQEPEIW